MFIRVKKSASGLRFIQLVENKRIGEKTKQTVLKHIGSAKSDNEVEGLKKMGNVIMRELEKQGPTLFDTIPVEIIEQNKLVNDTEKLEVDLKKLREESRIINGIQDIYGKLYDVIGFDKVINNPARNVASAKCLKQITLARIASPKSKRSSVEILDRNYGIQLNLDTVYDMMGKIKEEQIDKIQKISFDYTKSILGQKVNVLFLDATTLYFESQNEDELRKKGFSKDGKFHETQIMLVLFVTTDGLPVGYKVYEGNHYEGNTLKDMVEEAEKRYEINKIFLVADSGFLNEENTKYLDDKGYNYIIGARPKNYSKDLKNQITNLDNYIEVKNQNKDEGTQRCFETEYKGKRLVCTYRPERAEKDRKDREKNIKKLEKIEGKDIQKLVSNFGYKKFIKVSGNGKIQVNEDKVKEAEKWDGIHAILTNDRNSKIEEIIGYYGGLWQIEESFRINKHDLLIRPIFHWTAHKIKAHIAIAYMSFVLVRHLEYRMKMSGSKLSPERIRTELLSVQSSLLVHTENNNKYIIPSRISPIGQSIYKAMNCKYSTIPYQLK